MKPPAFYTDPFPCPWRDTPSLPIDTMPPTQSPSAPVTPQVVVASSNNNTLLIVAAIAAIAYLGGKWMDSRAPSPTPGPAPIPATSLATLVPEADDRARYAAWHRDLAFVVESRPQWTPTVEEYQRISKEAAVLYKDLTYLPDNPALGQAVSARLSAITPSQGGTIDPATRTNLAAALRQIAEDVNPD